MSNLRRNNPESSRDAARKIEKSGVAKRHKDLIIKAMRKLSYADGCTAGEIEAVYEWPDGRAGRRMQELNEEGLVLLGDVRICRVKKRKMQSWHLTDNDDTQADDSGDDSIPPVATGDPLLPAALDSDFPLLDDMPNVDGIGEVVQLRLFD